MHKVNIDAGTYVEKKDAMKAAQELEELFDAWIDKYAISKRSTTKEITISQEYG